MKKGYRRIFIFIAILTLLTGTLAGLHLTSRTSVPEGILRIETASHTAERALSQLKLSAVHGTVVNARGEERIINTQGILLSIILAEEGIADFSEVTVLADDEYYATVTAEEIAAPDKVYLIMQNGGRPQLIIFGDPDSKRLVSEVVCLKII